MIKITSILILNILCTSFGRGTELHAQQLTDYEKNLNLASELFLAKSEIPKNTLLSLVPKNEDEFELYYETTYPENKLSESNFFYATTRQIFEKVIKEKNDDFYLPSLKLISFADGEYAEEFVHYLQLIIDLDKQKFCESIKRERLCKL